MSKFISFVHVLFPLLQFEDILFTSKSRVCSRFKRPLRDFIPSSMSIMEPKSHFTFQCFQLWSMSIPIDTTMFTVILLQEKCYFTAVLQCFCAVCVWSSEARSQIFKLRLFRLTLRWLLSTCWFRGFVWGFYRALVLHLNKKCIGRSI